MDISPVTRAQAGGVAVVPGVAGHAEDLPGVHPPTPQRQLPPAATLVGATVEVEFARHSSGVQEVKFYDKRTGEVIDQYPIEKVLDTVSALIDLVRRKV